jgi:hypothetical protein
MPDISETEGQERERLRRRQDVRERIARRALMEQRAEILALRLRDLDAEAEEAAEAHRRTCEPIQSELAEVEGKLVHSLMNRRPTHPGLEKRRRELIDAIDKANVELSDAVDRIERLKRGPAEELEKAQWSIAERSGLESDLTREPLANPRLALDKFVAGQALEWAAARHAAAQKSLRETEEHAQTAEARKDRQAVELCRSRIPRLTAERDAAAEALRQAEATATEAYQRMIEE